MTRPVRGTGYRGGVLRASSGVRRTALAARSLCAPQTLRQRRKAGYATIRERSSKSVQRVLGSREASPHTARGSTEERRHRRTGPSGHLRCPVPAPPGFLALKRAQDQGSQDGFSALPAVPVQGQIAVLTFKGPCSLLCRRRKWHPTPVLLPGESHGRGAWGAAVHGVAKRRTRLSDLTFTFTFMHGRRKWHPRQRSCPENPRGGSLVGRRLWGRTESD